MKKVSDEMHEHILFLFSNVLEWIKRLVNILHTYIKRHTRNLKRKNRNNKRYLKINVDRECIRDARRFTAKLVRGY